MKNFIPLFFIACFFTACEKEIILQPVAEIIIPDSVATYKIIASLNWQSPQFSVPPNVHVTRLIGLIHSRDTFLWKAGIAASRGLEYIAEDGYDGFMNTELDSLLLSGKGISKFSSPAPSPTGNIEANMSFTTGFSCFSFASMIAPSPDWFMGINSTNLLKDNQWLADVTVPVLLYDAGTEDGDVFGYDNPPTNPQQPVKLLTPANAMVLANGNTVMSPIGTIRFVRID